MKNLSLKKRIIFQTLIISLIVPIVASFIVHRNNQTSEVYQNIANDSLSRVAKLGEMLSNFRQIRVEVRSLGLTGNSQADINKYVEDTKGAIATFEKSKNELEALLVTENEKAEFLQMDTAWKDFHAFGGGLLALAAKGDPASFQKLAEDVRVICPIKKEGVEKKIRHFIDVEQVESKALVAAATVSENTTLLFAILGTVAGLIAAVVIGTIFATKISNSLEESIQALTNGVSEINNKSQETAEVSSKISSASTQQASSLQETVASIDEISAMVARNADSATSAANTSEITSKSAQNGKARVEEMLESINAISVGNEEIKNQMQKSNQEISDIVKVINEIAEKTQVINDIVFQTKLLSFNASVEAARAGEHGKGFSVVADEVGKLASMSGQAANEISDMLSRSVVKVTEIVSNSKNLTDALIIKSKQKVETGTQVAKECASALDDILTNVSSMDQMVREISLASQEQSTGVREVNKAMSDLDQVTKANSQVAQASSNTASDLKIEADKLGSIVSELTALVQGKNAASSSEEEPTHFTKPNLRIA